MTGPSQPTIIDGPLSRRMLLDWLGKGCVLALGGSTLAACSSSVTVRADDSAISAERPAVSEAGKVIQGAYAFEPGEGTHPVYNSWGERTVDEQNLAKILQDWRLTVDGMVATPRVLTFADLVALPRSDQTTDFHCVEGWSIYDVPWNGIHLAKIFERVQPLSSATHVSFYTIGRKYNESLPIKVALEPRTLLAYGIGGSTLPLKHGFPLRLVVPRLYGYKSAKFVDRITLAAKPLEGYWVKAGYSYDGEVPDSRLRSGKY